MTDERERLMTQVLDSETFERLPPDQKLTAEGVEVIDSETFEPFPPPAPPCGPAKRLCLMIQRAFEAELDFYSRVFGRDGS
jgi:hypothetical protein